ncbi:MAG: M55 family metallopeptidase [Bryobacteraceae bacterium]|nr:M55 family metallopeptidase [Bryobacteraceae bacterium]
MLLKAAVVSLVALSSAFAQNRKSVFVITDAEGVAGVCRQEQVEPTNAEMQKLLTGEINAAVRGFFNAGADEVIVWDGHDGSRTLSALTIHPRAKLIIGALGPSMLLERKYSAVAFIGQHARANRSAAVMAHSYSSLGYQKVLMNGKEVGEVETRAALAGWFGVPVIFLAGDQAAADDLLAIVPDAEVAVVKEGLGYYSCLSLSAEEAQKLIEEKAAAGLAKLGRIRPYRLEGPVTIETEYSTRSTPFPQAPLAPGIERVDARKIRCSGRDFMEAWTLWNMR